jgi:hypothetical protein
MKKCNVKYVGMEDKKIKLASIKDMIFVAHQNKVKIYRMKYDVLEQSKEYTLDFDEIFYKVQEIELEKEELVTKMKAYERNGKLLLVLYYDFEMYVYMAMKKVFREADQEFLNLKDVVTQLPL